MIPKIIHYCWFGEKPFPPIVVKCLESWKKILPDYELMLWNESNSPIHHPYVSAASSAKKYAFMADYVRFWALKNYGGIYLDTDVLVIKSFDELLGQTFFCGLENVESVKAVGACVMGAERDSQIVKQILYKYDNIVFDEKNINQLVIPYVITPILEKYDNISVYPSNYFYPMKFEDRETQYPEKYATSDTYAIHLYDFSWIPWYEKLLRRIVKYLKKK